MTKLEARFGLETPLTETQLARLSDTHKIYGLLRVRPVETPPGVFVEYDASRVSASEVEAVLRSAGIAACREQ